MCFVRCPAPNRSIKEYAVELSLCISTFIGIPRSWYIDLKDTPITPLRKKLCLSNAQCRQALKRRSRFHSVVPNPEPPISSCFLETGSPAKSLFTKTVILSTDFVFEISAPLFFPTRYRAARVNGTKSNSRSSVIPWANVLQFQQKSDLCWAKYESLIHADLYLVASLFKIRLRLPSNTSLSCSFSRGVLTVQCSRCILIRR